MHRLFFAVRPVVSVRGRLSALSARLGRSYSARWVRPARYHLTVCFLGTDDHFRREIAERAECAAASVCARTFSWRPDRVRAFRAARPPCVLCASEACAPLLGLRRELLDVLTRRGVEVPETRPYVPHVTLGYGIGRPIRAMAVPPVEFPVHAFSLLHSISGESTYRELGCWPLVSPQDDDE